jgi:DNA gyrase subunit A
MELDEGADAQISEERFLELQAREQFLLTITKGGFGKRTSAYEYRLSGRGGQGVTNIGLTSKNGNAVAATFPVTDDHQIMLVTNGGQMIRLPVNGIRFTGRSAQGVTVFRISEGEEVVSVAWLKAEQGEDEEALDDVIIDSDSITE